MTGAREKWDRGREAYMTNLPLEASIVLMVQDTYRPAVRDALDACLARFGERLRAVYLRVGA